MCSTEIQPNPHPPHPFPAFTCSSNQPTAPPYICSCDSSMPEVTSRLSPFLLGGAGWGMNVARQSWPSGPGTALASRARWTWQPHGAPQGAFQWRAHLHPSGHLTHAPSRLLACSLLPLCRWGTQFMAGHCDCLYLAYSSPFSTSSLTEDLLCRRFSRSESPSLPYRDGKAADVKVTSWLTLERHSENSEPCLPHPLSPYPSPSVLPWPWAAGLPSTSLQRGCLQAQTRDSNALLGVTPNSTLLRW